MIDLNTILINILFVLFLFNAIFWSLVNTAKIIYGHGVSWKNFFLQSAGITGLIYLLVRF